METPRGNSPNFLVELEPRGRAFWSSVGAALRPVRYPRETEIGMWRDVFVRRPMPWGRFFQSAVLHTAAIALIWALSLAWLRQQNILAGAVFDSSSLVTYSPEEYLPPLDTGASDTPKEQPGDPAYAKQPILSVPPEADNRTQTIVAPPDLKLSHDVPLPNIVATGAVAPMVPLDATRASMTRIDRARDRRGRAYTGSRFDPQPRGEQFTHVADYCAAARSIAQSHAQFRRARCGSDCPAARVGSNQRARERDQYWPERRGGAGSATGGGSATFVGGAWHGRIAEQRGAGCASAECGGSGWGKRGRTADCAGDSSGDPERAGCCSGGKSAGDICRWS